MSAYFARFADFTPDPTATVLEEFARLARLRGWKKGSKRYKKERRECLMSEYDLHIGVIDQGGKLQQFQALCRELGINDPPDSIRQCKLVLKTRVHVNLIDLIDSRRLGTQVRVFKNRFGLVNYTRKTGKFFPLGEAKRDTLKKILLRDIIE